jgi:hypothetical protein
VLALGTAGPACVDTEKQTYRFIIKGPKDAFKGAATVSLAMGDQVVASGNTMGAAFTLEGKDIDPARTTSAIFAIRVKDASGGLLAFGQTPELEVRNIPSTLSIFVQPPASIASARPSLRGVRDQIAVSGTSVPNGDLRLQTSLPVFGLGRERRFDPATGLAGDERLSNEILIYNPFTHEPEPIAEIGATPRAEMAAAVRPDISAIYIFGGLVREGSTERLTSDLFIGTMARDGLAQYFMNLKPVPHMGVVTPRRRAVMAAAGRFVVAFGGYGGDPEAPLDSFVLMDPDASPATPVVMQVTVNDQQGSRIVPLRMSATRVGHTATTVTIKGRMNEPVPSILVFGGAPPGGSVADLVDPNSPAAPVAFSEPPPAGAGRRDHAALEVTVGTSAEKQVLILGGIGDDGKPRADSLLFDPLLKKFVPGPVTLKLARSSFAAFVVDKDLVVVGGLGADGKPIANAELHDTSRWTHVADLQAVPRFGASASLISNKSVAIVGGRGDGEEARSSSREIEIYQPRQP